MKVIAIRIMMIHFCRQNFLENPLKTGYLECTYLSCCKRSWKGLNKKYNKEEIHIKLIEDESPYITFECTDYEFNKIYKEVEKLEKGIWFEIFEITKKSILKTYMMYENPEIIEEALMSSDSYDIEVKKLKKCGSAKVSTFDSKAFIVDDKLIFVIKILSNDKEEIDESYSLPSVFYIYYLVDNEGECEAKHMVEELINSYLKKLRK